MTTPWRLLCLGLPLPLLQQMLKDKPADQVWHLQPLDTLDELREHLGQPYWHAVVAEYGSHRGGHEALKIRNQLAPSLPFIYIAQSLDAEAAMAAVKDGASEVALLTHHRPLAQVIDHVLREKPTRSQGAAHEEATRFAALAFRHLPDQAVLFKAEAGGKYIVQAVNRAFVQSARLLGSNLAEADWAGKTLRELVGVAYPYCRNLFESTQQRFLDAALAGLPQTGEIVAEQDGQSLHLEQIVTPVIDSANRCRHLIWTLRDVSSRKSSEAENRGREARLREANLALVSLARSRNFHGDNLIDALKEITEVSGRAVNVARSSIWLYNHLRSKIRCIDLFDLRTGRHSDGQELFYGDHPSYFLSMEAQRVIAAHDATQDSRTREYGPRYLTPLGITSMLDAAVRLRGELVGVICLEHVGPKRVWTTEEEVFAAALADVVSLALEASERQRVEAELRESRQKLQLHLQHTPLGVIEFNRQFQIIGWNPAAETIFGYGAFEAIGQSGQMLVPPAAKDHVEAVWKQLLQARGGQRSTNQNVTKEGRLIDCEWYNTPLIDEHGKVIGVASLVMDISERLRAERTLKESEERFATAFQSSPIAKGIARLRDRRYIAVNDAWLRFVGLPREVALGKTLNEMHFGAADPVLRERLYEQVARGISQPPIEMCVKGDDGRELIGRVSAQLLSSQGEPCVLWSFEDLTELRAAQAEVRRLAALLKKREDENATGDAQGEPRLLEAVTSGVA